MAKESRTFGHPPFLYPLRLTCRTLGQRNTRIKPFRALCPDLQRQPPPYVLLQLGLVGLHPAVHLVDGHNKVSLLKTNIMDISYDPKDMSSLLSGIVREKDRLEERFENLTLHCVATSAALIGIVAVLGDIRMYGPVLRCLIALGVSSLSLSVLSGVCYCLRRSKMNFSLLRDIAQRFEEGKFSASLLESSHMHGAWLGKACPILLCLGILLLALAVSIRLFQ